jgi:hypothetical protein
VGALHGRDFATIGSRRRTSLQPDGDSHTLARFELFARAQQTRMLLISVSDWKASVVSTAGWKGSSLCRSTLQSRGSGGAGSTTRLGLTTSSGDAGSTPSGSTSTSSGSCGARSTAAGSGSHRTASPSANSRGDGSSMEVLWRGGRRTDRPCR